MKGSFNQRNKFIKAIASNDQTMLQLLADEQAGKVVVISNEDEENEYLKRL